ADDIDGDGAVINRHAVGPVGRRAPRIDAELETVGDDPGGRHLLEAGALQAGEGDALQAGGGGAAAVPGRLGAGIGDGGEGGGAEIGDDCDAGGAIGDGGDIAAG